MAGIPPLVMLTAGTAQGVMAYRQGRTNEALARRNAERAKSMQAYERRIKDSNIAMIRAEEETAQEQQDYVNDAIAGSIVATMGAAGASLTGSFMEVLGEQVMLGMNKKSMLRQKSLRVETSAENAGNLAIFNQEWAEYSYIKAAKAARSAALRGLVMGIAQGVMGFKQAGGDWSNIFGTPSSAPSTLLSQSMGESTLSSLYSNQALGFGVDLSQPLFTSPLIGPTGAPSNLSHIISF